MRSVRSVKSNIKMASTAKGCEIDFDTQVKAFCISTGGGTGSIFGGVGCFALGVTQEELVYDVRTGIRHLGIFVPKGFCEGRTMRQAPIPSRDIAFDEYIKSPCASSCSYGRICWDPKSEPSNFIRVAPELLKSAPKTGTLKSVGNLNSKGSFHSAVSTRSWALPQLLAFFAERVWCIKPPKLLISLIGSTTDFEMNVIERNQILNEVMNVAKETDAWITSIGLDSGIAKHVGEAKRATGIKVPLIGIAPWGLVEGRQALWDEKADGRVMPHLESAPFDSFSEHEKQYNYMKPSKTSRHVACQNFLSSICTNRSTCFYTLHIIL